MGIWESAQVRFNPTGNVQVFTGTHSHGQGHETTFAQLITEQLGVPLENIEIIHGDTAKTQFGMGTYGSRSLAVGGVAIAKACVWWVSEKTTMTMRSDPMTTAEMSKRS